MWTSAIISDVPRQSYSRIQRIYEKFLFLSGKYWWAWNWKKVYFVFPKQRSKSATNRKIFNKALFILPYPNKLFNFSSKPSNFEQRQVSDRSFIDKIFISSWFSSPQEIRNSWGCKNASAPEISVIFHVGRRGGQNEEQLLLREHEEHGDILQNNLYDSYQNLTCK